MENNEKLEIGTIIPDALDSPDKTKAEMPNETIQADYNDSNFNLYIEKCLSMVLHHEEVQQIVYIIKKVHKEFNKNIKKPNQES